MTFKNQLTVSRGAAYQGGDVKRPGV